MTGGKQWDTTNKNPVVQWLESPAGEAWSRENHQDQKIELITIKSDLPCDRYNLCECWNDAYDIWYYLWVA